MVFNFLRIILFLSSFFPFKLCLTPYKSEQSLHNMLQEKGQDQEEK